MFPSGTVVATIGTYPGYPGPLRVRGSVEMRAAANASIRLDGMLTGLEPSAVGGWHIHVGTTCDNASQVCEGGVCLFHV